MSEIKIPGLPNYVAVVTHGVEVRVPIESLTDAECLDLGTRWGRALIEHKRKRKENVELIDRLEQAARR